MAVGKSQVNGLLNTSLLRIDTIIIGVFGMVMIVQGAF